MVYALHGTFKRMHYLHVDDVWSMKTLDSLASPSMLPTTTPVQETRRHTCPPRPLLARNTSPSMLPTTTPLQETRRHPCPPTTTPLQETRRPQCSPRPPPCKRHVAIHAPRDNSFARNTSPSMLPLVAILEPLGAVLGHLGAILGSWGHLEPSWGHLRPS